MLGVNKTFARLKDILLVYREEMAVEVDSEDNFDLNTYHIMKNKKPMYFASVKINKRYVSFHLMPIYVFPELLSSLSPALKKQMQGKSCFNFKTIDDGLLKELTELTNRGYLQYQEAGYVKNNG